MTIVINDDIRIVSLGEPKWYDDSFGNSTIILSLRFVSEQGDELTVDELNEYFSKEYKDWPFIFEQIHSKHWTAERRVIHYILSVSFLDKNEMDDFRNLPNDWRDSILEDSSSEHVFEDAEAKSTSIFEPWYTFVDHADKPIPEDVSYEDENDGHTLGYAPDIGFVAFKSMEEEE